LRPTNVNHRLAAFDGERVSFRWRDYAHGGKQRLMTLDAVKFLRRFFLHVLPKWLRPHPPLRAAVEQVPQATVAPSTNTARRQGREPLPLPPRTLALSPLRKSHARCPALYRR